MAWTDTYEALAYEIDNIFTDRYNGPQYIYDAMLIIVDLESSDENAEEAAVQILPKLRKFYTTISQQFPIDEERRLLVFKINEFTERYNGDLTTFVNSISWQDGCVPYYWAEVTEESRFDTSDWTVCS